MGKRCAEVHGLGGAAGAQGVQWGVQGHRRMGLQLGIRFKSKLKVKERE